MRRRKIELVDEVMALRRRNHEMEAELSGMSDAGAGHSTQNDQAILRDVLDSMEEALVAYDANGNLTTCNRGFREMYGYTAEQTRPGVHFRELGEIDILKGNVAVGDGQGQDYLERKKAYRQALKGSFTVNLRDGRWIKTTDRRMANGGFVSVQVDTSETKKYEEGLEHARRGAEAAKENLELRVQQRTAQLKDSEAKLLELLDAAPVGIGIVDQENNQRLFANRRLVELFGGASADEMTAVDVADNYVNRADADLVQRTISTGGTIENLEIHRRRIDGSAFWALQSAQLLGNFQGHDARVVWIVDISAIKDAEAGVAEKEAQLRIALDNMPGGIRLVDNDLNYVLFNSRYSELYEFPDDLLKVGESNRVENQFQAERGDFGAGDPGILTDDWLAAHPVKTERSSWERTTPSGKVLHISTSPTPFGGFVNVVTDITERKKAEVISIDQRRTAELLHQIADAAAEAETLDETYQVCLDKVGDHMDWPVGHIYLLSKEAADQVVPSKVWHLSNKRRFAAFRKATEKTAFKRGEGLPGRVWKGGAAEWIVDVTEDTNFPRAAVAKKCGLKAGFAFPVTSEHGVIAVLEFFTNEAIEPDGRTLGILANVGEQLGSIILRKQAEADLSIAMAGVAEKERQLRAALDTMTDGIYVIDKDLNYTLFNDRYRELVDLSPDAIRVGHPSEKALREHAARGDYGEGDVDDLVDQRFKALGDNQTVNREMTINHGERIVELRKAPMKGGGAVVVISDITARKEAEREIAEKEAQLSLALNTMSDGLWVIDSDLRFSLFNERYRELMGLPEAALFPGAAISGVTLHMAQSGAWGEGDPAELSALRVAAIANDDEIISETTTQDGRILETRKAPRPGGGAVGLVTDITERKRAEEEIAQKERHLRNAMDNMPGGMIMVDDQQMIVLANQLYGELFGYPEELLEPGSPLEAVFKFQAERGDYGDGRVEDLVRQLTERFTDGEYHNYERRLQDGRVLEVSIGPITGSGAVAVATDITERKKAEREIAEKEAQLRMTMDNMPGAMFVTDRDLKIVLVNDLYQEYYGVADHLVAPGASMRDIIKSTIGRGILSGEGTDEDILRQRIESFHPDSTQTFEDRTPDGRYIQTTRTPAPDGHTISVAVDITERKEAERAVKENETIMTTILDNMPAIVFLKDLEGRFIRVNRGYQDQYGIDRLSITGKTLYDIYPEDLAEQLADFDQQIIAKGGRNEQEHTVSGDDGDTTFHGIMFPVLDDTGEMTAYGGVEVDITERKRAEEEITRAHNLITDSIDYASHIQRSALPDKDRLGEVLGEHFVIWEPCEQVGGDIYWHRAWGGGELIILADCTGHGVPGAFMTLIASGALDRALTETPAGDCAALIQRMHQLVQQALGQDRDEGFADDGLELGVCFLPPDRDQLRYSGANISLYIEAHGEVRELKGDRKEIGYRRLPQDTEFTNHEIETEVGMSFYMTTDGLPTQVGEATRLPFTKRGFLQLLDALEDVPMTGKADKIMAALRHHMGSRPQRDDISLIGFNVRGD